MTNRILDISEQGFYLRAENGLLVIEEKDRDKPSRTIPFEDIAVIILSNRQIVLSQSVLSYLAESKAFLIICNERNMPVSAMLPLCGHTLQAERFIQQASASKPTQKNLWKQLVCAKVKAQANLLGKLHGSDSGLFELAKQVKSGDPSNIEAQAAQRYWPRLFKNIYFYRQPQVGEPPNNLLDYGYAVLRTIVARAIVSTGLNVTFGIHHHNRSNSFCLADDLMEPFRPIVDKAVFEIVDSEGENVPLNKETKQKLISPLLGRFNLKGEWRTLFDISVKLASSLVAVYAGEENNLILPENMYDYQ